MTLSHRRKRFPARDHSRARGWVIETCMLVDFHRGRISGEFESADKAQKGLRPRLPNCRSVGKRREEEFAATTQRAEHMRSLLHSWLIKT